MRRPRFYIPQPLAVGKSVEAPENTVRHMSQVLRLRCGDEVVLFNGDNREYPAVIRQMQKKRVWLEVLSVRTHSLESPLQIHLLQAVSKGERMDWVVQKAVELGVSTIQPVLAARTNVKLSPERFEKKRQHWQGIVHSACEQCGRNFVPSVSPVELLSKAAATYANDESWARLMLNPMSQRKILATDFTARHLVLAVGPEGGFAEADCQILARAGFLPCSLGPRILRTETAAIAALSILQAHAGDL